jgi:leucyl aminopeptidase (aminopeptidase T)
MEVRNDYTDDNNYTHIDMWESDDDNDEGRTVAIVCRDTKKVFFIDNTLRNNSSVKEAIDEVLAELNKHTDKYYQPSFDDLTKVEGLHSFEVFASKEVAQKAFPGVEILEYTGNDIEEPTFVDERYKGK